MAGGHVPPTFFLLSGADSAAKFARDREGISTTSRSDSHFTLQSDLFAHLPVKSMLVLYSALRSVYRALIHPADLHRDHGRDRPPPRAGSPSLDRAAPEETGNTCQPASPPAPTIRAGPSAPIHPTARRPMAPAVSGSRVPTCRPRSRSS
ncbi:hypothetical protein STAFG_2863 [Streptomyces afghaniensis 772]|uniref:Uncharacterized protein n=1 Tax=Streptomyces afghaniensis 772 TaxID=1283301 RepID=S4MKM9_9ACTN|nr:hypothetical protein STAFG_2863 [Streptomyces afghaniensis 772]